MRGQPNLLSPGHDTNQFPSVGVGLTGTDKRSATVTLAAVNRRMAGNDIRITWVLILSAIQLKK